MDHVVGLARALQESPGEVAGIVRLRSKILRAIPLVQASPISDLAISFSSGESPMSA
jgi:hypothetical protein